MRELTLQEVEMVSGSGVIRDTSGWIGRQAGNYIGKAIGSFVTIPVISTIVAAITGNIGKKVGQYIGDTLGSFIENLFGITDSSKNAAA
ncbi:hypothetical protein LU631_22400 [Erwinia tracheiphila]|uniref:Uncharacterized protein n=1 Tax=Erwinia tracheiphila TaxID=65700 RepID=A0A0M2KGP5_9GAMM|nr:hypothetical protein [Erwinia tracheiphila]EOS94972.1 hypothetical protein ETR_11022 [Erwinia tracheiphila PSU-1]KKF36106.1 hypothetical protein SY86_12795 [Erwinia tracheiphila]UIA87423.1 hypothetical protein LU631_22400 [Erwinia tracheiphila]UIA95789.1 hypothetical protein LU633_20845 [Erwinia tracheiphila]